MTDQAVHRSVACIHGCILWDLSAVSASLLTKADASWHELAVALGVHMCQQAPLQRADRMLCNSYKLICFVTQCERTYGC